MALIGEFRGLNSSGRRPRQSASGPPGPLAVVVAAVTTLAVMLAGCGSAAPTDRPATPGPSGSLPATRPAASVDQAAIYAAIERQVEAIRELKPTRTVAPVLLDAAELQRLLAEVSAHDNTVDAIAARGRLLIALGLLPAGADLVALTAAFQNGQVAGFYRPEDGRLYVVSRGGGLGAVEKTTFAHEYTHALQDQHFRLLQQLGVDKVPHGDRDLGQLALIEGDATLSMTYWAQQHLSALELLQLLGSSLDPGQLQALNAMPAFLRDTALFPYQDGLQFVMKLQLEGGWNAVNAAFGKPPDSTEQILHPDRYQANEAPVGVTLSASLPTAMGAGWSVDSQDTLGEFQLRLWLTDVGASKPSAQGVAAAAAAATGWGGDRVALLQGPSGAWGVVLRSAWDSEADAAEFFDAAAAAVQQTARAGQVVREKNPRQIWVILGSDAAIVTKVKSAAGLPN